MKSRNVLSIAVQFIRAEESLDAKGEPIKDSRGEVIRVITIEPLMQQVLGRLPAEVLENL